MRQGVRQNIASRFSQFGTTGEVAALVSRVAPGPVLGPVPSRHAQLGIVAVGDRAPAGRERFLKNMWSVDCVDIHPGQHIDGAAQRLIGIERSQHVRRIGIDRDHSDWFCRLGGNLRLAQLTVRQNGK